jgi:hypothetical protein
MYGPAPALDEQNPAPSLARVDASLIIGKNKIKVGFPWWLSFNTMNEDITFCGWMAINSFLANSTVENYMPDGYVTVFGQSVKQV